jgi:DNA polymerase-1
MKKVENLILIDGSSLLHRAFYALPLLTNSLGEYTNGVYGFMTMLGKVLQAHQVDYLVVCFDKSRITFRNQLAADYKGTRKETPSELRDQFEILKEVLSAAGICWLELENYEADDLLGTLSLRAEQSGRDTLLFSGDADVLQLVDEHTVVYLTKKGISKLDRWDKEKISAEYGLSPGQLADLKGLSGDSSDNISGVPGVGPKTALKLIGQSGSVEALYEDLAQVDNAKLREKLAANKDKAFLSKQLATIERDCPIETDWQKCKFSGLDSQSLLPIYRRLEFKKLIAALPKESQVESKADVEPSDNVDLSSWPVLDKAQEIRRQAEAWAKEGPCALYFTWQGHAIKGDITTAALASAEGQSVAMDFAFQKEEKMAALADGLAEVKLITANSKELSELFACYDQTLPAKADDVILAAYLLDPSESNYDVAELAAKNGLAMPQAALDTLQEAARRAAVLGKLFAILRQKIEDHDMLRLYEDVELPLARVLAAMEEVGVRVEGEKLHQMSAVLAQEAQRLSQEIYELAGEEFNLNSPKQLSYVLFEKLQLPALKKNKSGYSTDAEVLEQLAAGYPIADKILQYRTYSKLKSTYADGLWQLIDPSDGKIHTSFMQTVTATGRLSSVAPNLQNIPVRMELGRRVRQVFVASPPDNFLLAGDYNQIELRILAHMSGDEKLIEAFLLGEDIHARTASEVMGIPMAEITKEQRRRAKAVNFGIIYGISDYGLSRDLGISRAEAKDYIDKYFARYPKVEEYQKKVIKEAEKTGYVSTILGRRRYLPHLLSKNFNLRSFAQRMAINTPIQGSAADVIKLAMVDVMAKMEEKGLQSRLILQVHDELIFDVPPAEKEIMSALAKESMESVINLAVPMKIDLKYGPNWYDMIKME